MLAYHLRLNRSNLLVMLVYVKLRAEIHDVNARIVSFEIEEIGHSQENIVLPDDFSLLRRPGDAQLVGRRTDDRARLEEDDPVLVPDVVRMDADLMARHFSAKD